MLQIEAVSKSFKQKLALNDISMEIREGEILGLLGPNGAGKTTLIRIINQILEPDRGVIRYRNSVLQERHLIDFGYLPEERGLYRTMTVEDHALFLGKLRGLSTSDVRKSLDIWMEKFQIADWKKKRIEELSKGMAQKVQFICAVLHDPSLLILDEPFSGFDPINVELIQKEIKEFRRQGKAVMVSSHNMKSVEELCDRVVLIHHSNKILEGRVSEIKAGKTDGRYAVRFRGTMIAFVTALWTGFELVEQEELGDNRYVAYVRMRGQNKFNDLLQTLIGQIEIEAAWEVQPSMQDIFIQEVTEKTVQP